MASPRNNKLTPLVKTRYKFIVSACLAGVNCTFRAGNKKNPGVMRLVRGGYAIGICPEVAGGLTIPRENCEIVRGGVVTISGKNVTSSYISGAKAFLTIARQLGIKKAILKSNSPACGIGRIYDGRFSNTLKNGDGILASMLRKEGFKLYTPDDYFRKKLKRRDICLKKSGSYV
jgi:uncharacterized protein YbbK (DUF523 family)